MSTEAPTATTAPADEPKSATPEKATPTKEVTPATLSGQSVKYTVDYDAYDIGELRRTDVTFDFHDDHITHKSWDTKDGAFDLGRLRCIVIWEYEGKFGIKAINERGGIAQNSCTDASAVARLREAVVAYGLASTDAQ
jgi:hypothetical protein